MKNRLLRTGFAALSAAVLMMSFGFTLVSDGFMAYPPGEGVQNIQADEEEPLIITEKMPSFEGGGLKEFRTWVCMNFTYPQEAVARMIMGTVVARFVVGKDGWLKDIEILKSPSEILSDEVIRVMKESPRWTPGENAGGPVPVQYVLTFELSLIVSK